MFVTPSRDLRGSMGLPTRHGVTGGGASGGLDGFLCQQAESRACAGDKMG